MEVEPTQIVQRHGPKWRHDLMFTLYLPKKNYAPKLSNGGVSYNLCGLIKIMDKIFLEIFVNSCNTIKQSIRWYRKKQVPNDVWGASIDHGCRCHAPAEHRKPSPRFHAGLCSVFMPVIMVMNCTVKLVACLVFIIQVAMIIEVIKKTAFHKMQ